MLWVFRSPRLIAARVRFDGARHRVRACRHDARVRPAASADARIRREPDRRGSRLFDPVFRRLSRRRARLGRAVAALARCGRRLALRSPRACSATRCWRACRSPRSNRLRASRWQAFSRRSHRSCGCCPRCCCARRSAARALCSMRPAACLPAGGGCSADAAAGRCAMLLAVVAVPGWLRLTSDDDIRLLIQRDPALMAQEREVRGGGRHRRRRAVLRRARRDAGDRAATRRSARREARCATRRRAAERLAVAGVVRAVGAAAARRPRAACAARLQRSSERCARRSSQAGFRDEVADAWIAADASPMALPSRSTHGSRRPGHSRSATCGSERSIRRRTAYAAVVIPQGVTPANEAALIAAAHAVPGVSFVDKAASVSKLFGEYRVDSGVVARRRAAAGARAADAWRYRTARRHCHDAAGGARGRRHARCVRLCFACRSISSTGLR